MPDESVRMKLTVGNMYLNEKYNTCCIVLHVQQHYITVLWQDDIDNKVQRLFATALEFHGFRKL